MRFKTLAAVGLLVTLTAVASLASTLGNPETKVINDFLGATDQFTAPGQNFAVAQAVEEIAPPLLLRL